MTETTTPPTEIKTPPKINWLYDVLLVLLLVVGGYYRTVGLDWDDDQNLHPDERFLTGVETALIPVKSLSEYWNTETSTLNPHNQGHSYFVYGTLPIFAVRYTADWIADICGDFTVRFEGSFIAQNCEGWTPFSWSTVNLVGRLLSAWADLLVVVVVYLAGSRLYDKRVGIIAAAFSTFTVLQIQLSHFFTVDTFLNLFTFLSIYFAIRVVTEDKKPGGTVFRLSTFLWFGAALGMAVASKVTTFPVAVMLPAAVLIRLSKMKAVERNETVWTATSYLVAAALVSVLIFRIFQPYAFNGPGFLGLEPNKKWVDNLLSLRAQTTGDVDWPPSIQWASRPVWFSFQNMVLWGMGLPMGIMAWGGFLWVGWRMLKGNWQKHIMLWGWTAVYLIWQSSVFNPTMRYEIPIYPPLAVFAGWAVVKLWGIPAKVGKLKPRLRKILRPATVLVGVLSLCLTFLWATAFIQIYTRPVTRVEASDWIYNNLSGPLTLAIETDEGLYNQPLSYPYDFPIRSDLPYRGSFAPKVDGTVSEIFLKYIKTPPEIRTLTLWVTEAESPDIPPLATVRQEIDFSADPFTTQRDTILTLNPPAALATGKEYLLRISLAPGDGEALLNNIQLHATSMEGEDLYPLSVYQEAITPEVSYETTFGIDKNATLVEVNISLSIQRIAPPDQQTLSLKLSTTHDFSEILAAAEVSVDLSEIESEGYLFELSQPVDLTTGTIYHLQVSMETDGGTATLLGSAVGKEEPWDDALPLRTSGYDGYGGIYQRELNFDMYADDNPQKLERFIYLLENSEYFTISSSRQWASTSRIPERFPLNITFYRHLLGCPKDKSIEWCYNVAKVGMFEGNLGFDLVKVFQSDPNLGTFRINDQFAEEAFTVYDHPKVFIFQKSTDYDHNTVTEILESVDLSKVVRVTPKKAGNYKDLLIPADRIEEQRAGGTWAELFNVDALINRSQIAAVVVWYLAVAVLGLAMYPLLRLALSGLPDRGYPMARAAGLLLLAYLSWMAGSTGISFNRPIILGLYGFILILGIWQGYRQREELKTEWQTKRKYFFQVEGLFLAFFIFSLLVRYGNPDLWHPAKGGEKPMDFSYFNAVLKSTSFPPYDPWYAGGYINYYYYGFVYVGVLVKMLGIVPALAYNLIIPTLFAMLSMGAFSIGWNLIQAARDTIKKSSWWVGLAAALGTGLLGNMGSLRMIFRGFQQLGAADAYSQDAFFLTKWVWAAQGFMERILGNQLPYGLGHWYWIPSRVIRAVNDVEPITEFPWFTFIYADLHAHMIALPITVLAIGWGLSVVLGKAWEKKGSRWQVAWSFVFGGLVIGAMRPTNTWDLPTYLALCSVAVLYAVIRFYKPPETIKKQSANIGRKIAVAIGAVVVLAGLTFILYQPYARWYAQPYSEIQRWLGTTTPTLDYLTHWGLFLFIIVSWLVWETRQWMASTPLSSLRKLEPHLAVLVTLGISFLMVLVGLFLIGVRIHWLALTLAVWAAILLLRPGIPEAKRAVLFMVGTCLFLTMMVEIIVLTGDIGRMNTVFKFYLQVWVMFAVCSAAALGWLFKGVKMWAYGLQIAWQLALILLVGAAALFPLLGTTAKIRDRISEETPHTLDGMAFMPYSEYVDVGGVLHLEEDYLAIQWLQQNVEGSPVIVEGNPLTDEYDKDYTPLYHWVSRMTIYTGLPGVLGWDWHQIQQRGFVQSSKISERLKAIKEFYTTTEFNTAKNFLAGYEVKYIILGELERNFYPGPGLDKFEQFNGSLWQEVYRNGATIIYKVIEEALSSE